MEEVAEELSKVIKRKNLEREKLPLVISLQMII